MGDFLKFYILANRNPKKLLAQTQKKEKERKKNYSPGKMELCNCDMKKLLIFSPKKKKKDIIFQEQKF